MIKAVKIQENFLEFLEKHPEIYTSTDDQGNIKICPKVDNLENWSFTNFLGIISISYTYNGEFVKFPNG